MARARIRPGTWNLTYEITTSPSAFSLLDTPGRICDVLLETLAEYNPTSEDFQLENGDPGERALVCDLTDLSTTIYIRGDRTEIQFVDCTPQHPPPKELAVKVWRALEAMLVGLRATSHSIAVEMEAAVIDHTYQEFLNRFAQTPPGLPSGTQTAVVFYLPPDPKLHGKESSLVFNRTENAELVLQLSATLVYERLDPANAVEAAWDRLGGLLGALEINLEETQ